MAWEFWTDPMPHVLTPALSWPHALHLMYGLDLNPWMLHTAQAVSPGCTRTQLHVCCLQHRLTVQGAQCMWHLHCIGSTCCLRG